MALYLALTISAIRLNRKGSAASETRMQDLEAEASSPDQTTDPTTNIDSTLPDPLPSFTSLTVTPESTDPFNTPRSMSTSTEDPFADTLALSDASSSSKAVSVDAESMGGFEMVEREMEGWNALGRRNEGIENPFQVGGEEDQNKDECGDDEIDEKRSKDSKNQA